MNAKPLPLSRSHVGTLFGVVTSIAPHDFNIDITVVMRGGAASYLTGERSHDPLGIVPLRPSHCALRQTEKIILPHPRVESAQIWRFSQTRLWQFKNSVFLSPYDNSYNSYVRLTRCSLS